MYSQLYNLDELVNMKNQEYLNGGHSEKSMGNLSISNNDLHKPRLVNLYPRRCHMEEWNWNLALKEGQIED